MAKQLLQHVLGLILNSLHGLKKKSRTNSWACQKMLLVTLNKLCLDCGTSNVCSHNVYYTAISSLYVMLTFFGISTM